MYKKCFLTSILILVLLINLNAQTFSKNASKEPILLQKGDEKYWCPICGMKLEDYYKTNHVAKLQNGTKRQYCSLNSLLEDKKKYGIDDNSIQVIDIVSQRFIKAKEAFYVIGSKVKGTMSQTSKLAFAKEEEALTFVKSFGGKIVDFNTASKSAHESYLKDKNIIKNKKIKKIYPMGKKIYKKMCKTIEPNDFIEINELKATIIKKNLCKDLKEKHLQAVALYLWEVKSLGTKDTSPYKIKILKTQKCPVCGMFVAKYPRWIAQISYIKGKEYSFDGVKDMMKFYFNPKKWGDYTISKDKISKIIVTDYYSQKPINGLKAFYVIGSDVYGPMGNELIPFQYKDDAKIFKKDHLGLKIVTFDEIKKEEVYKLDEFKK